MAQEITLFDLPSRDGKGCWSPNTWKGRLYLNFKGLPYKTVWVEYPDIKPLLHGHVEPGSDGLYTLPAVLLPDGKFIMGSKAIAIELDKRYSANTVQLDSVNSSRAEAAAAKVKPCLTAETVPKVPKLFLNEASQPYFNETRTQRLGMPLDRAEKEKGGSQCYSNARPHIQELTAILKETPEGPFFGGKHLTFADIEWVALLKFYQRISPDLLGRVLAEDKDVHLALMEVCQPWLERATH